VVIIDTDNTVVGPRTLCYDAQGQLMGHLLSVNLETMMGWQLLPKDSMAQPDDDDLDHWSKIGLVKKEVPVGAVVILPQLTAGEPHRLRVKVEAL